MNFTVSPFAPFVKVSFMAFILLFMHSTAVQSQRIYKEYEDGSIYVKLRNDVFTTIRSVNEKVDVNEVPFLTALRQKYRITEVVKPFYSAKTPELDRTYRITFADPAGVDEFIAELYKDATIEYAEKIPLNYISYTPNDPSFANNQWYLKKIGAEKAWDISKGDPAITVAIVDNAIAINHPDLAANAWVNPKEVAGNGQDDDGNGYVDDINGWDTGGNDNNPNPTNASMSHGTHCAGDAAAVADNGTGIASIGFNVSIISVKCTKDASGVTTIERGYEGITYAAAAGARVISCSWGGYTAAQTNQAVITAAYNKGCIVLGGAGNDNRESRFYPGAYDNAICVSASDNADKRSSFSNYGSWIDVTSPGSNIYSTMPNGTYTSSSGTSMATPIAAGLCALMLSKNPSLTPKQVEECLKSSATNIDNLNSSYAGKLGTGRINAEAALKCVAALVNNAPVANFMADVTTTCSGKVSFTDQSTNTPTSWIWDFGDGNSATQQHPIHTYTQSGSFTVKLTATNASGNNQAVKNAYITVNLSQPPTVTDVKRCGPGIINLPAAAPNGTLNWYDAATGGVLVFSGAVYSPDLSQSATFYVENTTGQGCVSARVPINAIVHTLPATPVITKNGNDLVSSTAAAYQWNLDGAPISGKTSQTFTPNKNGSYSVSITDQNGCSSTSRSYDFIINGIGDNDPEKELRTFPNPSNGMLILETTLAISGKLEVQVLNAIGNIVFAKEIENNGNSQRHELDISTLPAGIYIIEVKGGDQVRYTKITKI